MLTKGPRSSEGTGPGGQRQEAGRTKEGWDPVKGPEGRLEGGMPHVQSTVGGPYTSFYSYACRRFIDRKLWAVENF